MRTVSLKVTILRGIALLGFWLFVQYSANASSQSERDSIVVSRQITSKKHKIKLFPSASQEVLFFSASGEEGRIYQLFLFDTDGRLVKQANIRHKQTTVVNNIEKGVYLFEVFSNDERIENGQVFVK